MTYRQAFPDFDHEPAIPADFVDVSWKNDACPSWQLGAEFGTQVYVNYKDKALREFEAYCFVLAYPPNGDTVELYVGDDLEEAIRVARFHESLQEGSDA